MCLDVRPCKLSCKPPGLSSPMGAQAKSTKHNELVCILWLPTNKLQRVLHVAISVFQVLMWWKNVSVLFPTGAVQPDTSPCIKTVRLRFSWSHCLLDCTNLHFDKLKNMNLQLAELANVQTMICHITCHRIPTFTMSFVNSCHFELQLAF